MTKKEKLIKFMNKALDNWDLPIKLHLLLYAQDNEYTPTSLFLDYDEDIIKILNTFNDDLKSIDILSHFPQIKNKYICCELVMIKAYDQVGELVFKNGYGGVNYENCDYLKKLHQQDYI